MYDFSIHLLPVPRRECEAMTTGKDFAEFRSDLAPDSTILVCGENLETYRLGKRQNRELALIINAAVAKRDQDIRHDEEEWLAKRLIAWIKSGKPANIGFTEGPLRQVAYAIEDRIRSQEGGK